MVQSPIKPISLSEFLALPETTPANEYVAGKIFQKPMPQGKHSIIQGELVAEINRLFKRDRIAYAFPELRCTFSERSLVPDVAVFQWVNIPRDDNGEVSNSFSVPPDWTIEILSPDQSPTRVIKNILSCLKHGTEMGWLIDPSEQTVLVWRSHRETEVFDLPEDLLPVPKFAAAMNLSVQNLFAWLLT